MGAARDLFKLGYELSPIILTGGIAQGMGGMLPIIAITEAVGFVGNLLRGDLDTNTDNYFAHFKVLPGGTLIDNDIAEYPFANQTVAANAIVRRPNNVSMEMVCPANTPGGYVTKLLSMTGLKQALDAHNFQGGTYTIATPAYIYTNMVMRRLRDMGSGGTQQVQARWVLDFTQPLVTEAEAGIVYSALMGKIGGGLPQTGVPAWSDIANSVGNTLSGAAASVVSGAQNLVGISASQGSVSSATAGILSR